MKISVIVTTYSRPDALKKVLDGLINQTRVPEEIVIADDGSGEETKRDIESYLSRLDVCIVHVWQEDNGFRLSRIRNKAISRTTGDYIVVMDGDCIPEPRFIEDHENLAEKGCFFQGKRVLVNQSIERNFNYTHIQSLSKRLWYGITGKISNSHHIFRVEWFPSFKTKKLSGVRGCNMGFFRGDLLRVNGYNQQLEGWGREDQEIVARLYKLGLKRKENPFRAICYHLWHPENARDDLIRNDQLLNKTIQSDSFFCQSGIVDPRYKGN